MLYSCSTGLACVAKVEQVVFANLVLLEHRLQPKDCDVECMDENLKITVHSHAYDVYNPRHKPLAFLSVQVAPLRQMRTAVYPLRYLVAMDFGDMSFGHRDQLMKQPTTPVYNRTVLAVIASLLKYGFHLEAV